MAKKSSTDRAMHFAVMGSLAFYGAAWAFWALRPDSESALPAVVNGWTMVFLLLVGLGFFLGLLNVTTRGTMSDRRPLLVAFLGVMLGMTMIGVVEKEPQNFYSVSAGVFASLILALASGLMKAPNSKARKA